MILTLEVVGPQAANLGHAARKTFTSAGGTIGRANDNDWIIPDSYVSGTHARIQFRNNRFFVVDSSANGTSLKSRANRLTRGQWYALTDMDRLFLDTVEIRVRVDNPAERVTAPIAVEPPFTLIPPAKPAPQPIIASTEQVEQPAHTTPLLMPTDAVLSALSGDRDLSSYEREFLNSPLPDEEALTKALERPPADSDAQYGGEHTTAMIPRDFLDGDEPIADAAYEAPRTLALNPAEKPQQRASNSSAATPAPLNNSIIATGKHQKISVDAEYADIFNTMQPAAQQPVATPAAFLDTQRVKSLLLSGVAAPVENITPEITDTLTQILRECIQGLLQLQQQREAMKDEFRLSVTKFKSAENNPLRFSANVEDALYNLLVKRNPAYLAPADAVTSSFKDAQWHQTAMQQAISTAFFNMMQQFDPQRFNTSDSKSRGLLGALFGNGENVAWQQYNKQYAELRKQADGGFAALFGSAFAHAYQEQLDRLRQEG